MPQPCLLRLDKKLKANGADFSEAVCLSDHTSKWNMDIYVSLNKEINDPSLKRFNGSFYSKVYEGDFKDGVQCGFGILYRANNTVEY